jgi:hypothetical protein
MDQQLAKAHAEIVASGVKAGQRYIHRKTGHLYYVLGPVVLEAGVIPAVAYGLDDPGTGRSVDPTVWVRPLAEFIDGRFTQIV